MTVKSVKKEETPLSLAEKQHKQREMQIRRGYKTFVESPEGQDVLRDILDQCGLYVATSKTTEEAFFNEGRRAIATYIIGRILQADSKGYAKLLIKTAEENHGRRENK